nr:SDR family NAD(P)-dependent oxidoreductase [Deltaproteobacteria bacterium]
LGRDASLLGGATDDWREMLEVNVLALCVCTREAVADMRRRGDRGHVVHVSSMASHRVPRGSGVYSATKYAVRALTEGLRQELRDANSNIRITAVSPGFVRTEFAQVYHRDPAAAAQTYGRYPVLEATDVAEAVSYVLQAPARVQVHDVLMRSTAQPD